MSGETERDISGFTVDTLKVLLETRIGADVAALKARIKAGEDALALARIELERRLNGLNELRQEVTNDRAQFVKADVYNLAYEEIRRRHNVDAEKITVLQSDVKANANDISAMKNSLTWLTRLIAGALILGIIAFVFQRLGR